MRKFVSIVLASFILTSQMNIVDQVYAADPPKQIMVVGNQIVLSEDQTTKVRLVGMNIPSLEWGNEGEHLSESLVEANTNWNSNIVRLPLSIARWYGLEQYQSSPNSYQSIVNNMVQSASARGMYIMLDCHWSNAGQGDILRQSGIKNTDKVKTINGQQSMPDEEVLGFWREIAQLYGNNPAVLFDLYNEPKGVSWEIWRNGGDITESIYNFSQETNVTTTWKTVGHQQLVEAIRDAGAKNVIIAGGLDWGYDLRGIAGLAGDGKSYELVDQSSDHNPNKTGYGIVYDTHIYPWKGTTEGWDSAVGCVRKIAPVIAGECGWDWDTIKVVRPQTDLSKEPQLNYPNWVPELLDWFDHETSSRGVEYGNQMNWTGWCFHPSASPRLITGWDYTPTSFWGAYVKARMQSYGSETPPPVVDYPMNSLLNFDSNTFSDKGIYDGPNAGDYFTGEDLAGGGVDGSTGYKVGFKRQSTPPNTWGGDITLTLPNTVQTAGSKYFSFMMKGDGGSHPLRLELVGEGGIGGGLNIDVTDNQWHSYQYQLSNILNINDPSAIKKIKLFCQNTDQGTVIMDNLRFFTPDEELGDVSIDTANYPNVTVTRTNGSKPVVAVVAAYSEDAIPKLINLLVFQIENGNGTTNIDCSGIGELGNKQRISIMVWKDLINMQTSVNRVDINN